MSETTNNFKSNPLYWDNDKKRWKVHPDVKCYICKQGADEVSLSDIDGTEQLICWNCAH